jgi:nitrogen fixation protein
MDGSGTVKGRFKGPEQLYLGAKFGMKMRLGIPYVITNQVVEFKDNNLIAWQHLLRNVWRYELQEVDQNTTIVTETWDGRNALSRWWVSDAGEWVPKAMAKTLVKLKGICES